MPISLMPHIPDDAVVRGATDVVERYREFHRTQTRSQVTWYVREHLQLIATELLTQLRKLRERELT